MSDLSPQLESRTRRLRICTLSLLYGFLIAACTSGQDITAIETRGAGDARSPVPSGWRTVRHPSGELEVSFPAEWKESGYEHERSFYLDLEPPDAQLGAEPAFSISVDFDGDFYERFRVAHEVRDFPSFLTAFRRDLESQEKRRGVRWTEMRADVAGREAVVFDRIETSTPPPTAGASEVCDCMTRWYFVEWERASDPPFLTVRINAIAPAWWEQFIETAAQIVASITPTSESQE